VSGKIAKRDEQPVALPESTPPIMALLNAAVDKNVSVETLERLMTLHERIADRDAAMEFANALAAFQAACPPIIKQASADRYKYATLDQIANTIRPHLHANGLSYRWDTDTTQDGVMKIICHLSHVNGHEVMSHATMPIDTGSRGLNKAQVTGSAMTYGQRYSLIQVLGLTTCQSDDDGASACSQYAAPPPRQASATKPISDKQKGMIGALCGKLGKTEEQRKAFLKDAFQVDSMTDLTTKQASAFIDRLKAEEERMAVQQAQTGNADPGLSEIPE